MKTQTSPRTLVFEQKVILGASLPLIVLLICCSAVGLLYPGVYSSLTPNWMTQTLVQDGVNLFVVTPVLTVSALYAFQGVKFAFLIWGGTVTYLVYTFLIYCFSVNFNVLFLAYCSILGLSVFSVGWFFMIQVRTPVVSGLDSNFLLKTSGVYFIVVSVAFYTLWLVDVVPALLSSRTPEAIIETGLLTNPVHVIDLSIFLPVILISGVMALKARPITAILIPVILIFFILMDITIASLTVVMIQNGFGGSKTIVAVMGALTLFSLGLLVLYLRNARVELSN